jgi:hypothetical protein
VASLEEAKAPLRAEYVAWPHRAGKPPIAGMIDIPRGEYMWPRTAPEQ